MLFTIFLLTAAEAFASRHSSVDPKDETERARASKASVEGMNGDAITLFSCPIRFVLTVILIL